MKVMKKIGLLFLMIFFTPIAFIMMPFIEKIEEEERWYRPRK